MELHKQHSCKVAKEGCIKCYKESALCCDLVVILSSCYELETLDISSCRGVMRGQRKLHDGKDDINKLRGVFNI